MMKKDSSKINTFKDLIVWQEGHKLVLLIYKSTKQFPRDEQFGLVSQMRRSAVSITSNIAEGFIRRSYKDKLNFFTISKGSLIELENQLLISKDVTYLDLADYNVINEQIKKVRMLLSAFITKTKSLIT